MLNVATYCAGASDPYAASNGSATVTGYYFEFVDNTNNTTKDPVKGKILELNRWYVVSLLFDWSDPAAPTCTLSVDGEVLHTTHVFYVTDGTIKYDPTAAVAFRAVSLMRTNGTILLDDVRYRETPPAETGEEPELAE